MCMVASDTASSKYENCPIYGTGKPLCITLNPKPLDFIDLCMNTDADSQLMNLLEKYRHQRMIKHKSLKCLFTGPPRTGKTTLKKRLLKTIKNLISLGVASPSGGFENPVSVVIGETKERVTVVMESDVEWQTQHDLLDEAQTVLGFIHQNSTASLVPTDHYPSLPTSNPDPVTRDSPMLDPPTSYSPALDPPTPDPPSSGPDSPRPDPPHFNQPPLMGTEADMDTLDDAKQLMQEVLTKRGLRTIEDIEKTTTLYLMDTGGQPEFHEIMPLLLNGPALHLVFFNLAFDLDDYVFIQFCQQDGTNATITYKSSYTGKQMIYQLLSSLYYLSKGLSPDSEPAAVLIGTHLDQLKDQTEKELEVISDSLKQLLNTVEFHDQGFLTYPKEGGKSTIFIPVNNYSGDEEEIKQLQVFLRQVIDDRFDPVELPSSWLFFHLLLRHRYENSPGVCTLAECRALARGCGLDENDVPQVLRYIHQRLGTILFYEEVQGLNELVICDPNVLFNSIYHLVAVSFAGDRVHHTSAAEIRKTGEIPVRVLKRIGAQPTNSRLTNEHILDLLKHFNILAEFHNGAYFMPCLLQPDHSLELSHDALQSLCAPPLLVCFDGNYIPIGVFSTLVVKLSQSSWEPDPDLCYRNHISFLTDGFSSVELMVYPSYLEFRIPVASCKEEPEKIHKYCMEVRNKVVDTLKSVLDLHEHTRKAKFHLGFYCPGSLQADCQPHFSRCLPRWNYIGPTNLLCSKSPRCQNQCRLPHECTIWFDYWKVSCGLLLDTCSLHAIATWNLLLFCRIKRKLPATAVTTMQSPIWLTVLVEQPVVSAPSCDPFWYVSCIVVKINSI